MKHNIKRFISLFLVVLLIVLQLSDVLATPGAGGLPGSGINTGRNAHGDCVVFGIMTVSNSSADSELDTQFSDKECMTIYNTYHHDRVLVGGKHSDWFSTTGDVANVGAFMGYNSVETNNVYWLIEPNKAYDFFYMTDCHIPIPSGSLSYIEEDIKTLFDTYGWDKVNEFKQALPNWIQGQMHANQDKQNGVIGTLCSAYSSSGPRGVTQLINDFLGITQSPQLYDGMSITEKNDKALDAYCKYLSMLCLISTMCGGYPANKNAIDNFIQYGNADNAPYFTELWFKPLYGMIYYANGTRYVAYCDYETWMRKTASGDAIFNNMNGITHTVDYNSNPNKFREEEHIVYATNSAISLNGDWRNSANIHTEYLLNSNGTFTPWHRTTTNWRYTCIVADTRKDSGSWGKADGNAGFTFVSNAGAPKLEAPPTSEATIFLQSYIEKQGDDLIKHKDLTEAEAGQILSSNIEVRIGVPDSGLAGLDALKNQVASDSNLFKGADIKFKIEVKPVTNTPFNVNGTTALVADTYVYIGSGDTMPDVFTIVGDECTIHFNNTSFDKYYKFMTSPKPQILLQDTDIPGLQNGQGIKNKYQAEGTLTVEMNGSAVEPKPLVAIGVGTEKGGLIADYDTRAYDNTSWLLKVDEKEFHFYSQMRGGVLSEIKHNQPRDEQFEAMGGVPTTENMYQGWGATEYMVNFNGHFKSNGDTKRLYIVEVHETECWGTNGDCIVTCPGHSHSTCSGGVKINHTCPLEDDDPNNDNGHVCPVCSGNNITVYCTGGKKNDWTVPTCACGAAGATGSDIPTYGPGIEEHIGDDGVKHIKTFGCEHTAPKCNDDDSEDEDANSYHKHDHVYKFVCTQPIESFNYLDIENMSMWLLDEAKIEFGDRLWWFQQDGLTEYSINPNLGYKAYYSQGKYTSGNGRLAFTYKLSDEMGFGDTVSVVKQKVSNLETVCRVKAIELANAELPTGTLTKCTAISDYLAVITSEGVQYPCIAWQYNGHETVVKNEDWVDGKFSVEGDTITWDIDATYEQLWGSSDANNGGTWNAVVPTHYGAWDWKATDPVRSGYNGNYSNPNSKYTNGNRWLHNSLDPDNLHNTGIPVDWSENYLTTYATDENNHRLVTNDIFDVIDSTDNDRNWSSSDNVDPIYNGEKNTGNAYVHWSKMINYGNCGTDFGNLSGGDRLQEAVYYQGADKVNNIVIFNPVSVEYTTLVSNPDKYDLRTDECLDIYEAPFEHGGGCPNDVTCAYQTLICTRAAEPHNDTCYVEIPAPKVHVGGLNSHVHTSECGGGDELNETGSTQFDNGILKVFTCQLSSGCSKIIFDCDEYNGDPQGRIRVWRDGSLIAEETNDDNGHDRGFLVNISGQFKAGDIIECYVFSYLSVSGSCRWRLKTESSCTGVLNYHTCTSLCHSSGVSRKVITCTDPHHYSLGQPIDENSASFHYEYGDSRCWKPCGDDNNHKDLLPVISTPQGTIDTSQILLNLDREFSLYYPCVGNFEQSPSTLGIPETVDYLCKGYTDNMDTTKWTREKYVTFPFNVIEKSTNQSYLAGTPINLFEIDDSTDWYNFYMVLDNNETAFSITQYTSIANNAQEVPFYIEVEDNVTNKECASSRTKYRVHTANKTQFADVVGYIGNLTLEDTGDFRFAELFKVVPDETEWLVENLVHKVDYNVPKNILTDVLDIRQETASNGTKWHNTYGVEYMPTGGKAYENLILPLTPSKNNNPALKKQPMRPGYNLYMDVSTVGNYYSNNVDSNMNNLDDELYYRLRVTPRYWNLNLDTGVYTPVDVYSSFVNDAGTVAYEPVCLFNEAFSSYDADSSKHKMYLNWLDESMRRNNTASEIDYSKQVQTAMSYSTSFDLFDNVSYHLRLPVGNSKFIGTATRLELNDTTRTFIGSSKTYGVDKNPQDMFSETQYMYNAQRYHFTLGLPSSTVFVEAGHPCVTAEIDKIRNQKSVIVCAINIKAQGNVWNLEYDGSSVNNNESGISPTGSMVTGFKVFGDSTTVYPPPEDPETGKPLKDPIIVVYHNELTSRNDLRTEGTH